MKILSTYREAEVIKLRNSLGGVSEGSPDLRPHSHLKWLADKLNVDIDALFLWCLRLATDRFYEVISEREDPTVNALQVEVRKWTTRQRIKFKADSTQAIVNAMSMASCLRKGSKDYNMLELTPQVLMEHLKDFYFVGTDPSCVFAMDKMKSMWEESGRPSTHFYQGFKEIRFETIKIALAEGDSKKDDETGTVSGFVKACMGKLNLRDGFKISDSLVHLNEDWLHSKFGEEETRSVALSIINSMDARDVEYMSTTSNEPYTDWMKKGYSPDRAEGLRTEARNNPRWGGYKLFKTGKS